MKIKKKKGKVHPSPSSNDMEVVVLSVLSVLPEGILGLVASVLSLEEREVIAYMIRRSSKKQPRTSHDHNTPMFCCDCFHCYTAYWFRWDSSPNRHLIHRAIDAFEDHLSNPKPTGPNNKPNPPPRQLPLPVELDDVAPAEVPPELVRTAGSDHRGLARKVLPDVLGLFNSRLWSLWNPNA